MLHPGVSGSRAEQGPRVPCCALLLALAPIKVLTMCQALSNLILTVQLCDMLILVIVLREVKGA